MAGKLAGMGEAGPLIHKICNFKYEVVQEIGEEMP